MNLFGNSLKFTSVRRNCEHYMWSWTEGMCTQDGYVHVMLQQYPHGPDEVRIELSVIDTGKVRFVTRITRYHKLTTIGRVSARIF